MSDKFAEYYNTPEKIQELSWVAYISRQNQARTLFNLRGSESGREKTWHQGRLGVS